ncbi:hypothetical protein NQ315_007106 [Exocentrus adspersus]|uniref:Prohormone-3 n=1 Tax=Exocentrus adspersus TaxID=1586481 RepID=A0AAV8WCS7_9CUCU|nr:hypothetical protein NQ315_007106 [Exocentrus adspersus]
MRAAIAILALCLLGQKAHGWGGLFNRFSPEMLQNMGYGGHGGGFISREGDEGILEEYVSENADDELCYGRRCTANEHCCPGSVCVDVDGVMGSCLTAYGRRLGELCRRDSDCESGLVCADAEGSLSAKVCQPPAHQSKQYSEPCHMSSECDISRGLCCQLQRRHRQAPRKMCSYFKDPLVCIGPVASDQIKNAIQHTAGEKRLTGLTSYKRPMP